MKRILYILAIICLAVFTAGALPEKPAETIRRETFLILAGETAVGTYARWWEDSPEGRTFRISSFIQAGALPSGSSLSRDESYVLDSSGEVSSMQLLERESGSLLNRVVDVEPGRLRIRDFRNGLLRSESVLPLGDETIVSHDESYLLELFPKLRSSTQTRDVFSLGLKEIVSTELSCKGKTAVPGKPAGRTGACFEGISEILGFRLWLTPETGEFLRFENTSETSPVSIVPLEGSGKEPWKNLLGAKGTYELIEQFIERSIDLERFDLELEFAWPVGFAPQIASLTLPGQRFDGSERTGIFTGRFTNNATEFALTDAAPQGTALLGAEQGLDPRQREIDRSASKTVEGALSEDEKVRRLMGTVLLGTSLTANGSDDAAEVLKSGFGSAKGIARLFAALCRAEGIHARVVSGLVYLPVGGRGAIVRHHWVELWTGEFGGWRSADPLLGEYPALNASHIKLPDERFELRSARLIDSRLKPPAATRHLHRDGFAPPLSPGSEATIGWTKSGVSAGSGKSSFSTAGSGWSLKDSADLPGEYSGDLEVSYSAGLRPVSFSYTEMIGEAKRDIAGTVAGSYVELTSERPTGTEKYRYELNGPLLVAGNRAPRSWLMGLSRFELEPGQSFPLDVLLVGECRVVQTQVVVLRNSRGRVVELRAGGRVWYRLRLDRGGRLTRFENLPGGLIAEMGEETGGGMKLFEE